MLSIILRLTCAKLHKFEVPGRLHDFPLQFEQESGEHAYLPKKKKTPLETTFGIVTSATIVIPY